MDFERFKLQPANFGINEYQWDLYPQSNPCRKHAQDRTNWNYLRSCLGGQILLPGRSRTGQRHSRREPTIMLLCAFARSRRLKGILAGKFNWYQKHCVGMQIICTQSNLSFCSPADFLAYLKPITLQATHLGLWWVNDKGWYKVSQYERCQPATSFGQKVVSCATPPGIKSTAQQNPNMKIKSLWQNAWIVPGTQRDWGLRICFSLIDFRSKWILEYR